MGCDIHCYVEYQVSYFDDEPHWATFGGHINPGRDYELFALMADVRNYYSPRVEPLHTPRGLPDDVGLTARWDNQLYVTDEDHASEGSVTRAVADIWLARGTTTVAASRADGTFNAVHHPDWHSHSWLNVDELAAVFRVYRAAHKRPVGLEYRALLSAMRYLKRESTGVRLVFWFDN